MRRHLSRLGIGAVIVVFVIFPRASSSSFTVYAQEAPAVTSGLTQY